MPKLYAIDISGSYVEMDGKPVRFAFIRGNHFLYVNDHCAWNDWASFEKDFFYSPTSNRELLPSLQEFWDESRHWMRCCVSCGQMSQRPGKEQEGKDAKERRDR